MDDELKRVRREALESPDDVGAALRLAAVAERAGKFAEAWTAVMRHIRPDGDNETAIPALRGLAARNPRQVVAYLCKAERELARFSCATLVHAQELVALVALSCDEQIDHPHRDAQNALWAGVEKSFPGIARIATLAFYATSERHDEAAWSAFLRSRLSNQTDILLLVSYGYLIRWPTPRPWPTMAREIVERARSEKRLELLPWLTALLKARDHVIAADAAATFQDLAGCAAPPLDPEDLSRRWVR